MIHFYNTLWLCANFPKWPKTRTSLNQFFSLLRLFISLLFQPKKWSFMQLTHQGYCVESLLKSILLYIVVVKKNCQMMTITVHLSEKNLYNHIKPILVWLEELFKKITSKEETTIRQFIYKSCHFWGFDMMKISLLHWNNLGYKYLE